MFANIMASFQKGGLGGKLGGAIVIDNNDPTKNQRVKYRMATLHKGQTDDELVWAIPLGWSPQGNSASGIGSIGIPPLGAKVIIFFPENDPHDSYYMADYHDQSTQIAELLEDYPHSYGYVDAAGNLFLINTLQKTVKFVHVTGSYVKFNADGSMEMAATLGITVYSDLAINFKSAIAINFDAPAVNFNEGLAPPLTTTPRTAPTIGSFSDLPDV